MLSIKIVVKGLWKNLFVAYTEVDGKDMEIGYAHTNLCFSKKNRFKDYMGSDTLRELVRVQVDSEYRGKGVATALLNKVIEIYGIDDLLLTVVPLTNDGLNKEQLTKFYSKFGFERTREFQETMIRKATA